MTQGYFDTWDDIRYVLTVATTGSFFSASQVLGTNQSTVSRRIQRLESRLGVKLFDRYSHGMRPTPSGAALVEQARAIEGGVHGIERHLAGVDQKMTGAVRLSAPDGLAVYWLVPTLVDFHRSHPEISLELTSGSGPIDLAGRAADIAIRLVEPRDPRIVACRVGHMRFSLFADRRYLDRRGQPSSLDDLGGHLLVDHGGQVATTNLETWKAVLAEHPNVVFRSDISAAFVAAVRAGYGVGLFPDFYRIVAPDLVQLPVETGCVTGIWLMSHEETNRSARVRAAIEFLKRRFRQDRAAWFAE